MFHESKMLEYVTFQPSANWETLVARQKMYQKIRHFFEVRNVLEVETPLLAKTSTYDPFIQSLNVTVNKKNHCYLQTSPEFHMKRLLSRDKRCIFQISKAFQIGRASCRERV